MMHQDSSHPTGVDGPTSRGASKNVPARPGTSTARARERKANAAVQLRLAGATWSEIAEALGYPTARQALVATEKALERQLDADPQSKEKMRKFADLRLERLLRSVWHKAVDPDNPEHLIAVTKSRELIGDHRKLWGLDAPTEVVVHAPTRHELETWVARVMSDSAPTVEEYDILDGEVIEETG